MLANVSSVGLILERNRTAEVSARCVYVQGPVTTAQTGGLEQTSLNCCQAPSTATSEVGFATVNRYFTTDMPLFVHSFVNYVV